ncbi:hypothetical protein WG68_14030 [Arsukibacterium ikkense]|uniref:Uncharacterized protein n=1 Tax=Arsukibacterium ikkense TaxID=336831 RepID=A0A0M2V676_9GAMM|nr:hypothetical protein [Arsukibacterium ikkense]KKO44668.1 hypothetical protein WG68_14030 [Arsukibacterium ikkense]
MHCSSTIKQRAVAGLWLLSLTFATALSAKELPLPASLQRDTVLTAPPYKPVTTPAARIPAVSNWLEVNQRVSQIGGWMFYAAEGAAEQSEHAEQPEQPKPKPEQQPHNHKGHQ